MTDAIPNSIFKYTRKIMGLTVLFSLIGLILFFQSMGSDENVKTLVVAFVGAVGLVIGFFFDKDAQ